LNQMVVKDFYDKLVEQLAKYNIPKQNILNVNEKGIVCGEDDQVKVFVSWLQKTVVKIRQMD
ncbi:hypothetical protein FRC17_002570, partial [Serendipita sp. 399]